MVDFSLERKCYVTALERDLESLVYQLRSMPEVHKLILFGSYAKGRRDLFTDLDLIVVMESQDDFVTRCAELAGRLDAGVALDLLVYTPAKLEKDP